MKHFIVKLIRIQHYFSFISLQFPTESKNPVEFFLLLSSMHIYYSQQKNLYSPFVIPTNENQINHCPTPKNANGYAIREKEK